MSADKISHQCHGVLIADCADVVQEKNILNLQISDNPRQGTTVDIREIAVIQDIDVLVIFHQERRKTIAKGFFDQQNRAAILFVGVFNVADGIIAADKGVVLGAGGPGAHIGDNIPPRWSFYRL